MLRLRSSLGNARKAARNICAVAQHLLDAVLAERNNPFRQVEVQDSSLSDERLVTRSFVDRFVVKKIEKPSLVDATETTPLTSPSESAG